MPNAPLTPPAAVSLYDARPFFEKALQYGVQHGIIGLEKIDAICADAPKGLVQIARYFGNEFLRPDLEQAKDRLVNLVSLHLESSSDGSLQRAAELLRDHSFLSRSKAGSDMLKALLALPESTSFDMNLEDADDLKAGTPPKGLAEWSLKRFSDYQFELARRLPMQHEISAALWLAEHFGMEPGELEESHTHAEAVIRTALLLTSTQGTEMPDWAEFQNMVEALRQKYRPAKTSRSAAASKLPPIVMPEALPEEFRAVVQRVRQSLIDDLPLILDASQPARGLFSMSGDDHIPRLLGRYFWIEDIASELDHHERAISSAWAKATGGHCDDGSLLTLFVCVAAGTAAKTLLSEKAANAMLRKIQKAGTVSAFDAKAADRYILAHAPAQHQQDYLELWADFVEEALPVLQNDSSYAAQDALALLRRECNIK